MISLALLLLAAAPAVDSLAERTSYQDPLSGLTIHKLTSQAKASNLYYHVSNFTADNSNVILAVQRGEHWQICRSVVATGQLVQLTNEPGVAAHGALPHPANPKLIYYFIGPKLIEMDIFTRQTRTVGTIPGPMIGGSGQPSFSHDLKSLAISKRRDEANYEIGLMDLQSGAYRTVLTTGIRIGHVQHSPTDPVIFYVWETGGYAPQRSWIVNDDGSANRPYYYRVDQKTWFTPLKEWMTHEAYVKDTGQMTMIMDKVGILLVEKDGASKMLTYGKFWHAAARHDGKYIVTDDFDGHLWLLEVATGNMRLLAGNTRRNNRGTHAHASFDRDGKWVLFNNSYDHDTVSIVAVPH
ncbi:MAG: hypothetical protein IT168_16925 [Bryobacterales bacterium]|nr:hypothetical protein [Bryobacterales bacterium]